MDEHRHWVISDPVFGHIRADTMRGQGLLHYRTEQILMADNELWRSSLRDCLRHMTTLPQRTLFAYLVLWHQATAAEIFDEHQVEVTEPMLAALDQREPTVAQLSGLSMIVEGIRKPAFGMKILEILEGKSISQSQVDSIRALREDDENKFSRVKNGVSSDRNQDHQITDSITRSDFDDTMAKLRQFALSDDDDDDDDDGLSQFRSNPDDEIVSLTD